MKLKHLVSTTLLATSALLGLNNSLAFGQTKYSSAAIEQARAKFKAELQSLQNSDMARYISDRRSPAEKQARNNFVNAWQKVDPDVAPFLGQWIGQEISWNIHPSSTEGRVCIMMNIFGAMYVETGKVIDGNIYTETGGVIFKEGDYLGIAAPLNNNFFSGKSQFPFRHPTTPRKADIDENIEDINKAKRVIQKYKDAGCTSSLPSNSTASSSSNTMTWQDFKTFARQNKLASLAKMIPSQFPNQFADGKIAITMLSNGGSSYVVAKEGIKIPNLSSVKELSQTDGSFGAVDLTNAVEFPLPALKDVPHSLYNSSQLIEVIQWASRYDSEGLRQEARQSQQATLSNGQKAYYLKQGNKRGWCAFQNESAQYSDYLCVNIAHSPKTSLAVLQSVLIGDNNFDDPNTKN